MLTRLHLRYTRETLPEDLAFQETADRQNFQVRYVLRHPWTGDESACAEAKPYFDSVRARQEKEAQMLAVADRRQRQHDPRADVARAAGEQVVGAAMAGGEAVNGHALHPHQ